MQQIEKNNIAWINLANAGTDDLLFLKDKFRLHSSVLSQLPIAIKRPKIEEYSDYLFLVLHFPVFNPKIRQTTPTELDFIITRKAIITIYQEPIPTLETFFNECLYREATQHDYFQRTGYLFFCILDKLIDSCLPMLDHIQENIDIIENKIFQGHEKEMLSEIAIVKRDIIDFRRTIKPQRSVLEILAQKANRFFDFDLDFISQEVIGSNIRVWNTLENLKDMIEAIEETNNSLLSYKINTILKTLTLLSFITFPLSLIAAILSMSTGLPNFLQGSYAFWTVVSFMVLTSFGMFLLFKKKKWL
ncbi:MAG: hypothetical protein A2Y98_02815 [Candidatus Portnoybacteria bacterium RBG_19FT_COMBO_36_7]|uniref:Magnesium transporter n=1 Tax=Candidatus Portnoybacteria bacterium RBG_19FT_COMBO_36_7 TaxID=1801992 RepID=A0A1G2FA89_9BACT|nr:MAG: hypothetical protein A2Y98_02815 [Candidatus Portnoybacteria bacterium RBG_19FT_COMBO_36_7]